MHLVKRWTEDEVTHVRFHRMYLTLDMLAAGLDRTQSSVKSKIERMKLPRKANPFVTWTRDQLDFLTDNYHTHTAHEIAAQLGKSPMSVWQKAFGLGLRKNACKKKLREHTAEKICTHYPTEGSTCASRLLDSYSDKQVQRLASKLGVSYRKRVPWTREDLKILKAYYPVEGAHSCYERMQRRHTLGAIYKQARRLKIKSKRNFTEREVAIIKKYYPTEGPKCIDRIPNHERYSVVRKARQLGLE